jgi:membrane-associated phospholipid phosphatase
MSGQAYSAQAVPSRRRPTPPQWSAGPAGAIAVAALCVTAMALVWAVAGYVPGAHFRDAAVLHDFIMVGSPRVDEVGNFMLHLLEPERFVLWGLALVAFAIARSRPRTALAVVAVMALAPLTSETLKPLVAHPHLQLYGVHIGPASWPSGHATAALALVLSAVLVASPRVRPFVAVLGAAFAAAIGCFLLILAWHMPSDVLGGFLVASLWTALAVAALRAAERRWPTGHSI